MLPCAGLSGIEHTGLVHLPTVGELPHEAAGGH